MKTLINAVCLVLVLGVLGCVSQPRAQIRPVASGNNVGMAVGVGADFDSSTGSVAPAQEGFVAVERVTPAKTDLIASTGVILFLLFTLASFFTMFRGTNSKMSMFFLAMACLILLLLYVRKEKAQTPPQFHYGAYANADGTPMLSPTPWGDATAVTPSVLNYNDPRNEAAYGWAAASDGDGVWLRSTKAFARHVDKNKAPYGISVLAVLADRWAYKEDTLWYDWDFLGLDSEEDEKEPTLAADDPAAATAANGGSVEYQGPYQPINVQGNGNTIVVQNKDGEGDAESSVTQVPSP